MMNELKNKKLFLLDLDGTIYLDDNLFDGTIDFLAQVKKNGGRYVFMTNNSSKSVEGYMKKLKGLGIETQKNEFLTSADAASIYLREKNYKRIYVFGTHSFKKQLKKSGLNITSELSEDIDCLCMGFDTELTFKKLEDACTLLNRDIDYIATNPDWVCPTRYGYVPDCGSVSEMLFRATGRKPKFIGKPEPEMAKLAMENFGTEKKDTVVIGDRLYTDIACGINAGTDTIFVLSGEGKKSDIQKFNIKPTCIYDNIKSVYKDLI